MNTYYVEIVTRFNLNTPQLPHSQLHLVSEMRFFYVYAGRITEQHLGVSLAHLEALCDAGKIVTYYYQQEKRERP